MFFYWLCLHLVYVGLGCVTVSYVPNAACSAALGAGSYPPCHSVELPRICELHDAKDYSAVRSHGLLIGPQVS